MSKTALSWFVAFLILLLVSCETIEQEQTPLSNDREEPTKTLQTTEAATQSPTESAPPGPTSTRVVRTTPITARAQSLEPGWQMLGDERFGLQVGVPEGWVDATPQLRMSDLIERFGPQMILLTNSAETGDRLLSGASFEGGSLIFGFITEAISPDTTPEEALISLLESADPDGLVPLSVESTLIAGMPAAAVELTYDPLMLFSAYPESMHYQLLLLEDPELPAPVVFIIGSSAETWISQQETFEQIAEQVRLSKTGTSTFRHIYAGDLVQGTLEGALNNIWTFTVEEDSYATISLTPDEGNIDLTLTLIDPAGNVMISVDNGYAGELEIISDFPLPEKGTYLIETSEFFNEPGRYRLSLLVSDKPEIESGGFINFGQEISGELIPDDQDVWYFNGVAGQSVTLILSSLDEDFDIILELHSPNNQTLVELNEGFAGDAEVLTGYELPLTGMYSVVVGGYAGTGGPYRLTLDEGGESTSNFFDVGDLVYGDTRQETLRKNEAHTWFFNGTTGSVISIEVNPSEPTMDLDIWLLDPDLQELVMEDEHLLGESEQISLELPVTGQYLILVREFFGEPGDYEISLNSEDVDPQEITGRLAYGDTVTSYLEPIRRDAWTFNGEVDDVVDILLTPITEDRDLVMLVIDPAGNTILTIDASRANAAEQLVAFRLTSGGEWKIVVKEFFNEGSEYQLNLTRRELEDERP